MYRLTIFSGRKRRRLTVQSGDIVIGGGDDCHLRSPDPAMAARHAVLEYRGRKVILRALHENAAIRVNGQPVRERELASGDVVEAGALRFEFQSVHAGAHAHRGVKRLHIPASLAIAFAVALQIGLIALFAWLRGRPEEAVPESEIPAAEATPAAGGGESPGAEPSAVTPVQEIVPGLPRDAARGEPAALPAPAAAIAPPGAGATNAPAVTNALPEKTISPDVPVPSATPAALPAPDRAPVPKPAEGAAAP